MKKKLNQSKQHSAKKTFLYIFIPVIICVVYAVLCMFNLKNSVWFDESYSAYLTRGNFTDIWNLTAQDVHPPFYYFLLKIWSMIFGYTDVSMRFMSIFFGAMTIIILFQLLKRWFNTKTATIASLLLAISPMFIRYGQEMRMYTLVFFIVALATYILDLALETKKTHYFVFYAILISIGMWTHYFTALAWIAHIIYYTVTKRAKLFSKRMILTYVLAVLLFVPWLPSMLHQVATVQAGFWIPEISVLTPVDFVSKALFFAEAEYVTGWLTLLALAVVIFTTVLLIKTLKKIDKTDKKHFLFLVALVVIPPTLLLILSLPPLSPIFVDRYVIYSASLIWVILGYLIVTKNSFCNFALAIVCVISAVAGFINVTNRVPESSVKEIVSAVKILSAKDEPIIMNNEWNYYDAVMYSTDEHPIYGVDKYIDYKWGSIEPIRKIAYNLIYDLPDFVKNHSRIWYITDIDHNVISFDEYNLPVEFNDMKIVSDIVQDKFIAFELEKTDIQ